MTRPIKTNVTIKDVARACNVSTQTISRVINKREDVSLKTREKVLAIIEQMGYQPSALARGMRQHSRLLGVVVTGLAYQGISTTLNGIVQAAEQYGMSVILKELSGFAVRDTQSIVQSLVAHQVQGIIYAIPEVSNNWNQLQKGVSANTPPMIFLKGRPTSAPISVSIDNYYGAYLITDHLISQGYRHIAHISGPQAWWEARERKRGWQQALKDHGLKVDDRAWVEGDWFSPSGVAGFKNLQQKYSELDAVFAANDQMALGVLHQAWTQRILVPEQLGIGGYDDLSESRFFTPPLTTIRQDFYHLGELAIRKLLTLLNPESADDSLNDDSIIIQPELIVRASSQRHAVAD